MAVITRGESLPLPDADRATPEDVVPDGVTPGAHNTFDAFVTAMWAETFYMIGG